MAAHQAPHINQTGVQFLNLGGADQTHVHLHLILEELHGAFHAGLAVRRHGVQEGTADTHALGAEAEGLQHVSGTTDPAVDVDLDLVLPAALAEDGHDLGENFDGGAGELELTTTVVGQHDTLHAHFDGAEDVLDALDALEQDGHIGDGLEPGDVLPGQSGVDEGGDSAGGALGAVDRATAAGLHIGADVGELGAHVLLTTAELRGINGDEETLAAAGFGVLDNALGDVAVLVHVELKPLHLVALAGIDNLVEGAGGQCGNHLDDIVGVCCTGEDDFTLRVAQLSEGGRGHVERH